MGSWRYGSARVVALSLAFVGALSTGCTSVTSSAGPPPPRTVTYSNLEGKRYCEVLVVQRGRSDFIADVYSSFPINPCPQNEWKALDAKAIASVDGGLAVILNGPRFWLMDSMSRYLVGEQAVTTTKMGRITMHQTATAQFGSLHPWPYSPQAVHRAATFSYQSGQQIYELTNPTERRWVMESWSQGVDPTLQEPDLGSLGNKLSLPPGWSYSTRRLATPLVISSMRSDAKVLQDNLANSYSLEVPVPS